MLLLGLTAPAEAMRLLHSERSLYREVMVYDAGHIRCMCFTRACRIGRQSCMDRQRPERIVMSYIGMMLASLYVQPAPESILIIGLGGGTLPMTLARMFPLARIDTVEIDPAVVRVARAYFGFRDAGRIQVFEMDGRVFVKRAIRRAQHYDLIMLDAFDHEYIPEHLLTREFIAEVKSLLVPQGVLAANTFSTSRLYDHESVTYAAEFNEFFNLKCENRVIIAVNGDLPEDAVLQRHSMQLKDAFAEFGLDAPGLLSLFSRQADWDENARVLTDQYSPANLLNLRRLRPYKKDSPGR
ncbi:spermidine synthase [Steroidobacter denitrificans]|uniref:Spermidine synthase n=1 Tax=Steroidobacter denitrificans TaxID=465721 RepID=A0A127FA83_STEDE|nr:spermidine synthase [Steroidobacter denitrificans]